jgi:hypothetical protein
MLPIFFFIGRAHRRQLPIRNSIDCTKLPVLGISAISLSFSQDQNGELDVSKPHLRLGNESPSHFADNNQENKQSC